MAALFTPGDKAGPTVAAANCPESMAGAAAQIMRASIPFAAAGGKGRAEAPFVMNCKIRRPAGALHAGGAGRIGQSAPYLGERRLGVLLAETGLRGMRRRQSRDGKCCKEKYR